MRVVAEYGSREQERENHRVHAEDGAGQSPRDQQKNAQVHDKDPEAGKGPLPTGEDEPQGRLHLFDPSAALQEEGLQPGNLLCGRPVRCDDPLRGEIREALRSVRRSYSAKLPPSRGKAVQGTGDQVDGQQEEQQDEPGGFVDVEVLEGLKNGQECGMQPHGKGLRRLLLGDDRSEERPKGNCDQKDDRQPQGGEEIQDSTLFSRHALIPGAAETALSLQDADSARRSREDAPFPKEKVLPIYMTDMIFVNRVSSAT